MVLQTKIPKQPSQAIVSYDYVDLTQGFGFEDFFLLIGEENNSRVYLLVGNQNHYSVQGDMSMSNEDEKNFDSAEFNQSRTIKGVGHISGSVEAESNAIPYTLTIKIYKVDSDGNETEVTSSDTVIQPQTEAAPEYYSARINFKESTIKVGDKLRVEIVAAVSGGVVLQIGTSPKNQDGDDLAPSGKDCTTITRISIPFRILT